MLAKSKEVEITSKKSKEQNKESNLKQQEFDFTPKYIIQWHCINEDPNLKNRKGYKTRVNTVKNFVDDSILYFRKIEHASNFINSILANLLVHYIFSKKIANNEEIPSYVIEAAFIPLNETTFTWQLKNSFIKFWIEIKQV
jgi:hypothetical protein